MTHINDAPAQVPSWVSVALTEAKDQDQIFPQTKIDSQQTQEGL